MTATCSMGNCNNQICNRGLCYKHYMIDLHGEEKYREIKRVISKRSYYRMMSTEEGKKAINERSRRAYYKSMKNPAFRVRNVVSSSLRKAMKNGKKPKWQDHLDWNIDTSIKEHSIKKCKVDSCLLCHLEEQFQPGMSWDNYGQWHIDHIIPQSVLPFENYQDKNFILCWSKKNLQPLWAADNIRKSNKTDYVPKS